MNVSSLNLFSPDEYRSMAWKEQFYWWHIGRRKILKSVLSRHLSHRSSLILDVGCGSGGNILFLDRFGVVVGLDPSPVALKFAQSRRFAELVLGRAERIGYPDGHFDVVVAFDVLEHLIDDFSAVREMARVSKDLVVVTVPAIPFLWSAHDVYLGHCRRYRRRELVEKIERAGLKVVEASYFITPTVPMIVFRKMLEKVLRRYNAPHSFDIILPRWLNSVMIFLLDLERRWLRLRPLPLGSSLYVVAQKQ